MFAGAVQLELVTVVKYHECSTCLLLLVAAVVAVVLLFAAIVAVTVCCCCRGCHCSCFLLFVVALDVVKVFCVRIHGETRAWSLFDVSRPAAIFYHVDHFAAEGFEVLRLP